RVRRGAQAGAHRRPDRRRRGAPVRPGGGGGGARCPARPRAGARGNDRIQESGGRGRGQGSDARRAQSAVGRWPQARDRALPGLLRERRSRRGSARVPREALGAVHGQVSASGGAPELQYAVTDFHIHIQPWRQLKPAVMETMRRGKEKHFDFLLALMEDPRMLLEIMDQQGIQRVGMVNYPSPNIMGFSDDTNGFAARYAEA